MDYLGAGASTGCGSGIMTITPRFFVRLGDTERLTPVNMINPHHDTLADWWREHAGVLHKIARLYADTAEERDDLVQDMLVQLWRSLPRFAGQCAPPTWIYRVCLNTALTWRRDETRRRRRVIAVETPPEPACDHPGPDARHQHQDRLDALYAAIRRLPKTDRVLILLLLDDQSYREIGQITGLNENQVGVALTRTRQKLNHLLSEIRHEL